MEVYKCIEIAGDMTYSVCVSGMRVRSTRNMPSIVSDASKLKQILKIINY